MINNLNEISDSVDLINTLSLLIPEGTEETLDINGLAVKVSKKDGTIKILAETKDDKVKELVKEYKANIEDLDDNLFISAMEDIEKEIDVKEFDKLLNQDHFTKEEAYKVTKMMETSASIIRHHLQEEITDLVELYDRF